MTDNFVFEIMNRFNESSVVELDFTRGSSHISLKKKEACTPAAKVPVRTLEQTAPACSDDLCTTADEPAPAAPSAPSASGKTASQTENHEKPAEGETVTCPIVGTFYRSPSPDSPAYAEKGAKIKKGEPLCIIEAMKMMNTLTADFDLEVIDVLIENATLAEYGQPLFAVKRL